MSSDHFVVVGWLIGISSLFTDSMCWSPYMDSVAHLILKYTGLYTSLLALSLHEIPSAAVKEYSRPWRNIDMVYRHTGRYNFIVFFVPSCLCPCSDCEVLTPATLVSHMASSSVSTCAFHTPEISVVVI